MWQNPTLLGIVHKKLHVSLFRAILIVALLCFNQEMQQSMNMLQPQQNLPDAAEMLTKWFGGGGGGGGSSSEVAKKSTTKSKSVRNR